MQEQKRLLWLDNLRGFSILLVVLGHAIQYFGIDFDNNPFANFIYSFHMPLFMCVSGFASYSVHPHKNVLRKRVIQLLFPYIIWGGVICCITGARLLYILITNPYYWFLVILLLIIVLNNICQYVSSRLKITPEITSLICFIFILIPQYFGLYHILSLRLLYFHFFFYSLGYYQRKHFELISNVFSKQAYKIMLAILFVVISVFYKRNAAPAFWMLPPSTYFFVSGLVGSFALVILFKSFCDKKNFVISFFGTNTLGIYVIHFVFCELLKPYKDTLYSALSPTSVVVGIWIILSVVSVFFSWLLAKNEYTALLVGKSRLKFGKLI